MTPAAHAAVGLDTWYAFPPLVYVSGCPYFDWSYAMRFDGVFTLSSKLIYPYPYPFPDPLLMYPAVLLGARMDPARAYVGSGA